MVAVLVGFMGAGKTTVGRIIAERLGQPFVDSDVLIEQRLGREIRDIFATEGEAYFRELEHATVADLVRGPEAVIALGGGAVEDRRTRAVLRNARVIYLRVSYDEAMSRIQGDRFRPLLSRPDLDDVYQRRLPIYEDVSVFTIDTDGRRSDAIAHEVLAELTRLPSIPPKSSSVLVTPVGGNYRGADGRSLSRNHQRSPLAHPVASCHSWRYHPYGWWGDGQRMAKSEGEKTEKITINLGLVDLGQIDLLVQEGFYTNRTDFIRTAIRTQLATRGEALHQTAARRTLTLGSCHYTRRDLEEIRDAGQMIHIRVLGLASIAADVSPQLALATIASVEVLGAFRAPTAVKAALAPRTA